MPGRLFLCLRLPCAPERYRANSDYTPRRLRERRFSTPSGFARLSRRMRECETQFQLSSSMCASLPGALPWHRRGLPSSIRLIRVEKLLQLRASVFPHAFYRPSLWRRHQQRPRGPSRQTRGGSPSRGRLDGSHTRRLAVCMIRLPANSGNFEATGLISTAMTLTLSEPDASLSAIAGTSEADHSVAMMPSERKITAYHEAGHAVVALALGIKVRRATIKPRSGKYAGQGRAIGPVQSLFAEIFDR
jgi:hypothetical protein